MNLDREIKRLEKKLQSDPNFDFEYMSNAEGWDSDEKQEVKRLQRMEEIHEEANNARVARCEAKMREVGGTRPYLDLIESGEWSDSMEWTPIEEEYHRLAREQFDIEWFRKYGKPYRLGDAEKYGETKFGPTLTKEHMEALAKKMEYHYYGPDPAADNDHDESSLSSL